ncbi:MAG: hypothetical protein D6698_17145, partial [Gammaproteobacteria bacterium]
SHAEHYYQSCLRLNPLSLPARKMLALLYRQQRGYESAFDLLLPVLDSNSTIAHDITSLIWDAIRAGQANLAEQFARKLHAQHPDNYLWALLVGDSLLSQVKYDEAVQFYEKTLSMNDRCLEALNNLAIIHQARGFHKNAEYLFHRAHMLDPENIDYMINLSGCYIHRKKLSDAETFLRKMLKKFPDNSPLQGCLARTLQAMGIHDEALYLYRKSLQDFGKQSRSALEYSQFHGSFLAFLNYPSKLDKDLLYQEHRNWEKIHVDRGSMLPQRYAWKFDPMMAERPGNHQRLRVGLVSGDFRQHSVAYFLSALLENYDRTLLQIYAYSTCKVEDDMTRQLRSLMDRWNRIDSLTIMQTAQLIRQDEVDILVDLSGFTEDNRLEVFALKPAPVQVTWLGYPNTTGLSAMDYRITDEW